MMVHFGLYSLLGGEYRGRRVKTYAEWAQSYFGIPNAEYEKLAGAFNPIYFDAEEWIRLAKDCGMEYFVITAKHHEGFALFDSAVSDFTITKATPFGRDLIAELAEACYKYGLKFGLYYSQELDWHHPDGGGYDKTTGCCGLGWYNIWDYPGVEGKDFSRCFEEKIKPQVKEILTKYGDLCLLWFDTPGVITKEQSLELHAMVKEYQPDCLINSRIGNGAYDYVSLDDNEIPNIEYIKWDMNRHMTCVGSAKLPPERQAEVYHRYMLGLYRVLETVTTAFPDVLFEGCSGGGGRFDAGQMHYFNQYWASDDTDAIERMYIQYGTSLVMPACFTSAHVSAVPNHQMHRTTSLKTRGYVAMNGQFGYELDITKLSDTELREIAEQIREYKRVREIIHQGNLYRTLSPFEGNHAGFVYVTEDQRKAVLFHFTIMAKQSKLAWRIKLQGLDPNKNYRLSGTEDVYNGGVLMHYGIYVHHNKDAESDMFVFEEA